MLAYLHADRLPRGHAAVLRPLRLPASTFPLRATQGLRTRNCFLAWGLGQLLALGAVLRARGHSVMSESTSCHAVIWTPAEGQQGGNRRTMTTRREEEDKRRKRPGQQHEDKVWSLETG